MLFLLNKEAGGQVSNGPPFDLGVKGKVEPFQGLVFLKGGFLYSQGELFCLPSFNLILYHKDKKGEVGEFLALRLGKTQFKCICNSSKLQLSQLIHEVVINHTAPPKYEGDRKNRCPISDRGAAVASCTTESVMPFSSMVLMLLYCVLP